MEFRLLRTHEQVAALSECAAHLIGRVIPRPDAGYTPAYFLSGLSPHRKPRVVACYDEGVLAGVFYISELYFAGFATGYLLGGDLMGRGVVLAAPSQEVEIFEASADFLLENGFHALRINWTPQLPLGGRKIKLSNPRARVIHTSDPHPEGDWLNLSSNYDDFLSRLGAHTRRNIRYYRRKVEAKGYSFSGLMREEELTPALQSLNRVADYPIDQNRLDRDRSFFRTYKTPVIAGLCDTDGQYISLITGFTDGTHLHILSQLNAENEELRKLSVSLVLRGYIIEEFILKSFTAVHFVHGSSPMLGRFCEPVDLQIVWIDGPNTPMTLFKKACASLASSFAKRGKRVPYRLGMAAGTYLQK